MGITEDCDGREDMFSSPSDENESLSDRLSGLSGRIDWEICGREFSQLATPSPGISVVESDVKILCGDF